LSIPPLRDLPPGRLAQRRGHLLFEITRERESGAAPARLWPVRRRRPRRKRILVFAAAALVAVVGTASAFSGVRAFFVDRGFIGLPPMGASPSTPESGELVVHWEGFTGTHAAGTHAIFRAWLYADGRFIWDRREHDSDPRGGIPEGANALISGYLEQRLTPEGVELVRSAVAELFARARAVLETVPAVNGWPPAVGRLALLVPSDYPTDASVQVPDGDRLVRLGWTGFGGNAKRDAWVREHLDGTLASAEQLSALRRVDALLTDPASVLPLSAWAVRDVRAYVPTHYAVCIDTSPPKDASQVLSLLPGRAADLLRDTSRTSRGGEVVEAREGGRTVVLGSSVTYCFKVGTEDAREVADAVSGLEPEPGWRQFGLAYRVAEPVNHLNPTRLWFEPYFPDGRFAFSGPFG
jgi:hypothetical protein